MHDPPISTATGTVLKLYEYCAALYEVMDNNKQDKVINEQNTVVWCGPITHVIKELQIPAGAYGKVMNQMYHLGCITRITSGSPGIDSVFALHHAPSAVPWTLSQAHKPLTPGGRAAKVRGVEQQVADILQSLGGLDVKAALIEFHKKLESLQQEVNALKRQLEGA